MDRFGPDWPAHCQILAGLGTYCRRLPTRRSNKMMQFRGICLLFAQALQVKRRTATRMEYHGQLRTGQLDLVLVRVHADEDSYIKIHMNTKNRYNIPPVNIGFLLNKTKQHTNSHLVREVCEFKRHRMVFGKTVFGIFAAKCWKVRCCHTHQASVSNSLHRGIQKHGRRTIRVEVNNVKSPCLAIESSLFLSKNGARTSCICLTPWV
mmetsp:Transcript_359/g.494  ORF Transcript_359/g.494 Transcript_359/m.494 type:complete len:207 (-) Transcript_359:200-820(-)